MGVLRSVELARLLAVAVLGLTASACLPRDAPPVDSGVTSEGGSPSGADAAAPLLDAGSAPDTGSVADGGAIDSGLESVERGKALPVGMYYCPSSADEMRRVWSGNDGGYEACNLCLGISGVQRDIAAWTSGLSTAKAATEGRMKIVVALNWPGTVVSTKTLVVRPGVSKVFADVFVDPATVADFVRDLLLAATASQVEAMIGGWYLADEPLGKFVDLEWIETVRVGIRSGEAAAKVSAKPVFVAFNLGDFMEVYRDEGYNWDGEQRFEKNNTRTRNPGWVPADRILIDWYGSPADWKYLARPNVAPHLSPGAFHAVIPGGEGANWGFFATRSDRVIDVDLANAHVAEVRRYVPGAGFWFWAWSATKISAHWEGAGTTDLGQVAEGIH
jgi:hypothetical protein